ncbi:MAG: hypothetical protein Fur0024_0410 [Patescibacteria group bacterium]
MSKKKVLFKIFATLLFFGGLFSVGFIAGKFDLKQKFDDYLKKIDTKISVSASKNFSEFFKQELKTGKAEIKFTESENADFIGKFSLSIFEPESSSKLGYLAFFSKNQTDLNYVNLVLFLEGKLKFSEIYEGGKIVADENLKTFLQEILPSQTFSEIYFVQDLNLNYKTFEFPKTDLELEMLANSETLKTSKTTSVAKKPTETIFFLFPAKQIFSDLFVFTIDQKNIFQKSSSVENIDQEKLLLYPLKISLTTKSSTNLYAKKIDDAVNKKFNDEFGFEFLEKSSVLTSEVGV